MASNSHVGMTFFSGYNPAMIGPRLRAAREHAGLSQRRAAISLGNVTHGAISQWESSGRIATDNLLAAAELYRCDPMWLLTGRGPAPGAAPETRETCDRATMTAAVTAVLTVLRDLGRSPPPAVTARIIDLIYNRHVASGGSAVLDAQRVHDIVDGVLEYLGDTANGAPGNVVVDKKGPGGQG